MNAKRGPAGPMATPGPAMSGDSYLPDHGNGGYRVTHYDLALDYRPGTGRLAGRAVLSAVADLDLASFSLDLSGLRAERVLVDGARPARFAQAAGKLRVRPARALPAGVPFTVEVRYVGTPRPVRSHWGEVGWETLTDGALVASQPIGAPSWFPCNDHPADKAGYRIAVTAPAAYTVVANGSLVTLRAGAGTRTWVYEQPAPTASYLATVQIGHYDLVEVAAGPVAQRAAVPGRLRPAFEHDFGRQPAMLAAFEDLFGPYPFADYAVVVADEALDVPIEAQAVSVFGANHVDGRRGSEHLVAHELAHQWFGNSLTVADWRHIWLNEGFANYAEWLWSEVSGGRPAAWHATRSRAALAALPQDLVLADPGVRRLFDDRVYQRGALALHALRTILGDRDFFGLLREWTAGNRHGTVTTEGFLALVAGRHPAAADALAPWLFEAALPALPAG